MARESWIERAGDAVVGLVSPRRAALRRHWRMLDRDTGYRSAFEALLRARGYKSAESGLTDTPWKHQSGRSADGELVPSLKIMRDRSRALKRDEPIARGIFATFVSSVVGTGVRPLANTNDPKKNAALDAVWRERAPWLCLSSGHQQHAKHQRMVYGKVLEDGEVLLVPSKRSPGDPAFVEVVEADRLDTPSDAQPHDPEGRIVQGVEKDRHGVPVAYWIRRRHPGDAWVAGAKGKHEAPGTTVSYFARVPASRVVHYRRGDERPGQTNGVPLLHSVLQDLHDFDLLMLASMKRSQVAACLSMFITSSAADEDLLPLAAEDYGYVLKEKLEPGGIMRLFPGEQAQFLSPNMQVPELAQLAMLIARRIGAGVGISPQAVLRIWEGLTYSAARTVMIDDDKTFDADRVDLVDEVLAWEWRVVHEDALLRGDRRLVDARVTIADLDLVRWIAQKRPWVDPKNEAEAIKLELEMGLTTVAEECARRGRDWREVIRQRLEVEAYTLELEAQASLDVRSAPKSRKKAIAA